MKKNDNSIKKPAISQQDVYNGGSYIPINTENLLNNHTAIDLLLNEHNALLKETKELRDENHQLKSELEYQRTTPFFAIIASIVNICGTGVFGIGVNLLSSDSKGKIPLSLIILGAVIILIGDIMFILHRWVRGWFNKLKKRKSNEKGLQKK